MNEEWSGVRRVLAVRLDNIGDVVMTGPALRAIKSSLPDARLTLLASPGGAKAAPLLLPWVDEVVPWRAVWQDLGGMAFDPGRELALIETLRGGSYDAAVVFTSFKQTPHPAGYACYLAGIPLRLGESKEFGGGVLSHEPPPAPDEMHQSERNLRLVESVGFRVEDRSLGVRVPDGARAGAAEILGERGVVPGDPYLLLNPSASAAARTYPAERFAAAAGLLSEALGWPVVVTGTEGDRAGSRVLFDRLGDRAVDLVGATDLSQLAAIVVGAGLLLTNNTSTMHLADALRTPQVVLYSGTELEEQWRPRSSPHRLLRRPTWCSPCYLFKCPYDLECLDIPPEAVAEAGLALLSSEVGELPA